MAKVEMRMMALQDMCGEGGGPEDCLRCPGVQAKSGGVFSFCTCGCHQKRALVLHCLECDKDLEEVFHSFAEWVDFGVKVQQGELACRACRTSRLIMFPADAKERKDVEEVIRLDEKMKKLAFGREVSLSEEKN